jgi:6-phosphogluconolactonase (cycloisomerase 2 family)
VSAVDSHGFEPRTFALDPSGRYMLVGNQKNVNVLGDAGVSAVLPNIAVFSVGPSGALTFVNKYDQTTGEVWWVGGRSVTGP